MVDEEKAERLYTEGLTQTEVAQRLGTTQGNISRILQDRGVDTGFTKWWDKGEVEFLERHYPPESEVEKEAIADRLCVEGRTWRAVRDKADSLGLTRPQYEYLGSDANKEVLRKATTRIEVDLDHPYVGYVCGVLDSDGYTNNTGQLGLEAKHHEFIEKFEARLRELGCNPTSYPSPRSSEKEVVYACSQQFVRWYETEANPLKLSAEQQRLYLEGLFEGDGTIHKTGYCMICSTDHDFKQFLSRFLETEFDFSTAVWQDGVPLVPMDQRERFLELIDPVIKNPEYYGDDR